MKRIIKKKIKKGTKEVKKGKQVERRWGLAARLEHVRIKSNKK